MFATFGDGDITFSSSPVVALLQSILPPRREGCPSGPSAQSTTISRTWRRLLELSRRSQVRGATTPTVIASPPLYFLRLLHATPPIQSLQLFHADTPLQSLHALQLQLHAPPALHSLKLLHSPQQPFHSLQPLHALRHLRSHSLKLLRHCHCPGTM